MGCTIPAGSFLTGFSQGPCGSSATPWLPASHVFTGGTRDQGRDPVDSLPKLRSVGQSAWRGCGGQLPI